MRKLLSFATVLFIILCVSVDAQTISDTPVLIISQRKDSTIIIKSNQEINTKIPRAGNFSSAGKKDDSETAIPKEGIMEKKKKPVKGSGKK